MQENTPAISKQPGILKDGPVMAAVAERDMSHMTVTVERELVSQVEEEDMEALLGTYVLQLKLKMLPLRWFLSSGPTDYIAYL